MPNIAPVITGPSFVPMSTRTFYQFTPLVSASDADGSVLYYFFYDTGSSFGSLTYDGVPITSAGGINVAPADLSRVGYYSGASVGTENVTVYAYDNLTVPSNALVIEFNIWQGYPNQAPTISGPSVVYRSDVVFFDFTSLVSATDADGTVAQYRFTDTVAGAGYLLLDGARISGTTVSAANLSHVSYFTGANWGGSNDITIEAIDAEGLASNALNMTINVNLQPTISGPASLNKNTLESFTFDALISAQDDSAVVSYRFTDVSGEGYLYHTLNGAQITGTSVTVTAANLGDVGFYTGIAPGTNSITIEAIDDLNVSSVPLTMQINVANQAPTISGPTSLIRSTYQQFDFTSLISATDADGTVVSYTFSDTTPGGAYLTLDDVKITGTSVTVSAVDLARVGYYTGTSVGSNAITIQATDNLGLVGAALTMTIATGPNTAPTITGPTSVFKGTNQTFDFTSGSALITAADRDGEVVSYRFTDSMAGAGHLTLNGAQIAGTSVTVSAADLGHVAYSTGAIVGSNVIAVESIDNAGASSPYVLVMMINVTATANQAPTISGPSSIILGTNQSFDETDSLFSSLLTAADADGAVALYVFTDSTPGAGYLTLNGAQIMGTSVRVLAAELGQVGYTTGPSAGSNSIAIEAVDDLDLATSTTMTIIVDGDGSVGNQAPTISGPASVDMDTNGIFTFSATAADGNVVLVASDADGVVAKYRFSDTTPGAGSLVLDGSIVESPTITVLAEDLERVMYQSGRVAGSNLIVIEAIDNLGLASTRVLTMTINVAGTGGTGNQAPTISGPASVNRAINESFTFTSLVSAGDADGTIEQYRFSDSTPGAGYLTLNGAQIAAKSVTVSAVDLGHVGYYTGASTGSNSIAIEAIDDHGLASSSALIMTINVGGPNGSANQAPTISGPASVSKAINESFTFTSLISAGDADGTVAQYRFSDSMPGAGYLTLNGAQIAGTSVTVSAASLGQVGYSTGASAGSNSIAIEAIDNLGLSSPSFLTMAINVAGTTSTGGTGGTGGTTNQAPTISAPASVSKATNESFTFTSLISAGDADGTVAQYRFSDNMSGAGYLTLNGVAAPSVFTVAAANLGQVGYYTGASAGSNAIAIEAIDNLGLASPNFVMMTIGVAGTTGTGSTAGTANQAPTISGPASVSKAINESFAFTSLIAAADADGTVAQYRFSDSTSGAGYLTLNGAAAPSVFTVAAAELAKVGYYTGLAEGSNSIAIEAIDNLGLASPGLLLTSIKVSGSGLSSNASSDRTVISSDGVGEAALIGTGGLLTVEAGASSANFSLHASGSNGVISDIPTGGIRYTFSNFSEFLFNGGAQGDTVKVGVLAGTSIGFQSVFLNGNGGNDTLDASAADRSILATGGAGQDRLFGGSQNDRLSGDAGDDQLSGGKGDDVLTGGDGNDIFSGLEGRDLVNGGAGDDVLQFTDLTTHAITALRSNSFMVTDAMGNLAIVRDVEHIQLAGSGPAAPNSSLAQDSLDQRVVELYVAAFGRAPETQGYDFWVDMESREGLGRVADTIFSLPVVKAIYADSMSANQFVTAIYENVFDRAPDVQGLNFWVNMLGSTSRGSLVLAMTSAALGVADGTQGKDFFENRVDWAMFAVHYQDATHNGLAPVYLHTLTDSVTADAASLITLVGQFEATLP